MILNIKDVLQGNFIEPKVAQIIAMLNQQNILSISAGEFHIHSVNYAAHEIVTNVDEKIFYLIYNWDFYNVEGVTKLLALNRRLTAGNRIIWYASVANNSNVVDTSKINPILINSLTISGGLANVGTCLLLKYFKITVQ